MAPFPIRRFTVDEYHHMIQAGVFAEDERFELLEGWIVPKMSRNPPHDVAVELTVEALRNALPTGWRVRVRSAVTLADSEPEPDVAVVQGPIRSHINHHPGPQDTAIVVEASESTLTQDRVDKGRVYARANIPVYWIINLVDAQVEVYTDPTGPDLMPCYRQRRDYHIGESVPLVIEGREVAQIPVRDLLP
jgi:Uma2 family endonuclease